MPHIVYRVFNIYLLIQCQLFMISPGGSQNDKQRNKLSCDILKEGSDKCGTLRVAKYAAVISSVAAGVSGIPVALLWHRQNSYSSNKEMIVLVTLIFFTVAIAAVFALVAAEMFRQFISDASEYSIDSPLSPGGEYIIETTWTFSFSWILMISSATIEILMIILTLFIYYDRAQVQSELDAQVFL